MKRTVYLVVISIITIGCIIFGTLYHTRNFSLDNLRASIFKSLSEDGDWNIEFGGNDKGETYSPNRHIRKTFDDFEAIKINANVMGVTIKTGDTYSIDCSYNREYLKPEVELKSGVLHISQHIPKSTVGNNNAYVIITIPSEEALQDMSVKVNVGEILIEGIDGTEFDVKTNVGSITIKESSFEELELKTNVGEVNIDMIDDLENYSVDLKNDVGEIFVNGAKYKRSYSSRSKTRNSIDVQTNVGEIVIR